MSLFQKILLGFRFIGLRAMLGTVLYALYRDWMNRGYKPKTEPQSLPGTLQGFDPTPSGGVFQFQNGITLEIHFLAPDIVRTTWTPGKLPVPYALSDKTLEETLSPSEASDYLATRKNGWGWVFTTPALILSIHPNGTLEYLSPTQQLIRREFAPELNGESWSQTAALQPDEHIYGLGERAAPLNLRGGSYRFWNKDPEGSYGPGADPLYVTIPVYIGQHEMGSYLVFHENSWEGEISFPESGESKVSFSGGALRTYFISGDLPHLTRRYSDLTGRAPLPPRWALGFHQSRWGYMNERDIREVVEGFLQRDLPLSSVHLDIDYMLGYRAFTVDEERFPDLGKLAADLDSQGVKVVAIIDPGVKVDDPYDLYQDGLAKGMFSKLSGNLARSFVWPGWCANPDFTSAEVRKWWGQHYARLLDKGVAGIWHDMNEPASNSAWGDPSLPRLAEHDLEGQQGNHLEAHNLYGMQMNRAGFEALEKYWSHPHPSNSQDSKNLSDQGYTRSTQGATDATGKRPWLLSRSGWAGDQRYAWHWTADTESSWAALKMTIAQLLNLGLSGYSFTGSDIGGFSGVPDAELFVRWFQIAAFMPFFRIHSSKGTPRREPWVYGEEVLGICREFMKLRERLMPYLYTLAWQVSQTGEPMCRPISWLEPDNPELWGVDDVFLLGNDLLIAPVIEPGAKLRRIPLTSGRWVNFWRDDVLDDSDFVESRVTLDKIPVLVRGGSILPVAEGEALVLHVYPDRNGRASGILYSDAGDGYGAWSVDRFAWEAGVGLTREEDGEFPFPYVEVREETHGSP